MQNKEWFKQFIEQYTIFWRGVKRLSEAVYSEEIDNYDLFDSDWGKASEELFDLTLGIVFTDEGVDIINTWFYKWDWLLPKDFDFEKIQTSEDLWNYLLKHKELYFKNV